MRGRAPVERPRGFVLREPVPEIFACGCRQREDWARCSLDVVEGPRQRPPVPGRAVRAAVGRRVLAFTVLTIAVTMTLGFITFPAWWWALPDGWEHRRLARRHVDRRRDPRRRRRACCRSRRRSSAAPRRGRRRSPAGLLTPTRAELERRVELLQETRAGAVDARGWSSSGSSATCTTARRRGSSRSRWTSAWPSEKLGRATPTRAARAGRARRAARPGARSPSCATSPAASTRRCSPTAASTRGVAALARALPPSRSTRRRRRCPATARGRRGRRLLRRRRGAHERRQARAAPRASRARRAPRRRGSRSRSRTTARGGADPAGSGLRGLRQRVDALDGTLLRDRARPAGRPRSCGGAPVRVVIAEDPALLRDGLDAAARATTASRSSPRSTTPTRSSRPSSAHRPDVCVVDVRLPPTFPDEGLRGGARGARARRRHCRCSIALAVRRADATRRSCSPTARGGVGYLLKDRVADVREFVEAVRRVAAGGTALDPEVVAQLARAPRPPTPLDELTPREREVLVADGRGPLQRGIAARLVVTDGAVEKHITSIFGKLGLPPRRGRSSTRTRVRPAGSTRSARSTASARSARCSGASARAG